MKYQLRMNVGIVQVGDHGEWLSNSNNLQVTEEINFEAANFLEIAHVLGQFHELSEKIKAARNPACKDICGH